MRSPAETFRATLEQRLRVARNYLCIGLDPEMSRLPEGVPRNPSGVARFLRAIVEATADMAACYKPNLAFYEALGADGFAVLEETLACIPDTVPVIADAKRGDVSNTAAAYARALFELLGFASATISPYLGEDSVTPFLTYPGTTILLLAQTSNASATEFQNLDIGGRPLYQHIVERSRQWANADRIGYVVGATHPEALLRVRRAAPDALLLVPGVGTQGGDIDVAVRDGPTADGGGLVVNVSRAILYAGQGSDFAVQAREVARRYADRMPLPG